MGWEEDLFASSTTSRVRRPRSTTPSAAPELADRSRAEYQQVTLACRLMASVDLRGHPRRWSASARSPDGSSGSPPAGACSAAPDRTGWSGSTRSPPCTGRRTGRCPRWPGHRSRGSASAAPCAGSPTAAEPCSLHLLDGRRHDGVLLRVGQDFVEVATGEAGRVVLVAFGQLAAVQSRR